jgi:hypothetical protein
VIEGAFAVNAALVAPAAIVTLPGTHRLALSEASCTVMLEAAAILRFTVQTVDVPAVNRLAVQLSDVRVGTGTASVAPAAVTATASPAPEAPAALPTPTELIIAFVASVVFTVATTPLGMFKVFNPQTIHLVVPELTTHWRFLPADANAGDATTFRPLTPAEGVNAHCNATGWLPPGALKVRLSAAVPPGTTLADDKTKEDCATQVRARAAATDAALKIGIDMNSKSFSQMYCSGL